MTAKPSTRAGYRPEQLERVRAACLHVATVLGSVLDELIVVGGVVPSLLVTELPQGAEPHVGTGDLDLGLTLGMLEEGRYLEVTAQLRSAGFAPDVNERGRPTPQRWAHPGPPKVTIDFLIPPDRPGDVPGKIRAIEDGFGAIITPGLRLALADRRKIALVGQTLLAERAERSVWVCGPAAFVLMKALAFRGRGLNKDVYDLVFVLRFHGSSVDAIAEGVRALIDLPDAVEAVEILRKDFETVDSLGPRRAAAFLDAGDDPGAAADAWAAVQELLSRLVARSQGSARSCNLEILATDPLGVESSRHRRLSPFIRPAPLGPPLVDPSRDAQHRAPRSSPSSPGRTAGPVASHSPAARRRRRNAGLCECFS